MVEYQNFKKFHFKNLEIQTHPNIYNTSEDTFLILEYINFFPKQKILEIGTGCGLISLESCRCGSNVICTDLNPYAIKLTKENIKKNKHLLSGDIEVRKGDLFSIIKHGELFDIIIFNPPYLPTTNNERVDKWFDLATDGGEDGLNVIIRFIKDVKKYLNPKGQAYFVFSSLADRQKLERYLKEINLEFEIVLSRRFDDETLDLYCIY